MANRKEPVAWITVKGVRVPIFEGQSKEDAFKSFKERIGKRNSNQPTTQAEKKRVLKEYTNARNAAHNAKPDKQEKAGERFEKAKQKYSESKEKTAIKSVQVKGDREARTGVYNEQLKEVQDDIRQAESTPARLRSGDYDKKLAELKQKEAELKGYIKRDSAGKKEQSQETKEKPGSKEYAVDYMRSLHKDGDDPVLMRKGDEYKAVSSYEVAEAGEKRGWKIAQNELTNADKNHIKSGREERKVPSNPHERVESLAKRMENAKTEQEREAVRNDMDKAWKDIDHNKKLDDREKNHLESRLRDIYDKSKAQANIKKNEDEKEKQIARNAAEKKQAEDNDKRLGSYKVSELRMSDDEYEKYVSDRLVKNGWKKEMADREAKQSVIDRAEDKSYFIKTGQLSLQDAWGTNKSSASGQYDKYKTGYKYETAKTVNVNGNEYKVWSDDTYKGTFAEDKNGKVLPIKQSGYLSKEVSQRKAIANAFGESSFRSKGGQRKNSNSGFKTASEWDRESAPKTTYDESKAKSYKITNGGLNRASQAAADTMGQSLFKNGRADIVIKEENARDITYSLRDKYGNEVGTFLQSRTEKKGTGKLTLYGVKTASKQKTNKK